MLSVHYDSTLRLYREIKRDYGTRKTDIYQIHYSKIRMKVKKND